ncbi:DUF6350 family protein [Leifsonia sp. LS-T14]|uniref:cell division protein PerM n=1 Tax=unclassified Leifsonia TaxID=2663824 RepID=UPI0035A71EDE
MSRTTVALLAALEALIVAAIGLGICLVPITILWAAQYHLGADFAVVWRSSADVWLVGHGVNLTVALDPQTVAQLGLPAAAVPFQVTIALLGFAALTAGLGVRTGMRAAETDQRLVGAVSALAAFAVISTLVVLSSGSAVVQPSIWQGIVLPPFVYGLGIAVGFGFAALRGPGEDLIGRAGSDTAETTSAVPASGSAAPAVLSALRAPTRILAAPERLRLGAAAALRAGTAATAIVIGVAALILALLIFGHYGTIISLYEQLQSGVAGGAALTVGQLAILPNLVVWIASWLVGPGFAIGTGSSVGPLGTDLGPLPGLPVFGVIPPGGLAFGLVGLVVPLLAGFLAAVLLRSRVDASGSGLTDLRSRILTALGLGLVAGIQLGLLAWWSSGALGPGRLHDVGPNPWLVGALAAAEVAVAAIIGLVAGGRTHR